MVTSNLIGLGLGLASLAGSVALLWAGYRTYRSARALQRATPPGDGRGSGKPAVVEGTIEGPAEGGLLEADWSGTPCVAYATVRIKQRADNPDGHWSQGRKDVDRDHDAIPFVLDTESGSVRVEAEQALVVPSDDHYEHVSSADVRENRGLLVGLWWLVRGVLTSTDESVNRQHLEARFRPGDTVHVIGTLSDDGTVEASAPAPLVVSSASQERVVGGFESKAKGRLVWGVILLAVATSIFLALAGVIG